MTPLIPQAQAVLDAYVSEDRAGKLAVAALRAAADQVAWGTQSRIPQGAKQREIRRNLLAIAAELEAEG